MSSGGASKTLDDLLVVLLEDDAEAPEPVTDDEDRAAIKAMVKETNTLIEKLHAERTMRRLAEAEAARQKRVQVRPVRGYEGPLPSKEQLVSELRIVMQAAGQESAFHAMKFQDAGPEDIAEMIASVKHLLKGGKEE
jgi:hypothetical protein